MNNIKRMITKSWIVLTLLSPMASGIVQISAEELVEDERVLLKDNTFILGRVYITEENQLVHKDTLKDVGVKVGLEEDNNQGLAEDFTGYLEVINRYKVGEDEWLEVENNGEPIGFIKQGRLEVKPTVRVKSIDLPEDISLEGIIEEDTYILKDLRFNGNEDISVEKGDQYTIMGLNEANFYTKEVESFKVDLGNGLKGWVKRVDIEDDYLDREGIDSGVDIGVSIKKGTDIYSRPTYLENTKSLGKAEESLEESLEGRVVDYNQNSGVREYYYKVYTNKSGMGYLKVNHLEKEVSKEIIEREEIDSLELGDVYAKKTSILTTQPNGVEGVSDQQLVLTEDSLKVVEKVTVKDLETEESLEEVETEEVETEEVETEEVETEEVETEEVETEEVETEEVETEEVDLGKEIYYYVESDKGLGGYILEEDVVRSKDLDEYIKEKEEGLKERESNKAREKLKNKEELVRKSLEDKEKELEEDLGVSLDDLEGWSVGQSTGRAQVTSVLQTGNTSAFIESLAPYSQIVKDKGLYPSVMMAQAVLESNGGRSGLARNSNNLFGIKGSYNGSSSSYETREYGGSVTVRASFRDYPSYKESVEDYVRLLNNTNYKRNGVVNASNPYASILGLKRAGYATDPLYVSKVWKVIEAYDLTRFD